MSVQKVNVLVPPLRPVPPAAACAANVVDDAVRRRSRAQPTGLPAWYAAVRDRRLAARAARRDANDRMALTALAQRYELTQPEFAKDLYAAARYDRRI